MHLQSSTKRRRKLGRNSTDEQVKEATINSQVRAVDEWDRANGGNPQPEDWEIDEGWSGFRMDRPGLQRILTEARDPARDWDELVLYDKSRLSREPLHRLYVLEPAFKAAGVVLRYVASPIYPDTATGRAMEWHQAGFDKWFAEQAKENMQRGLRDALREGNVWWCPYGYRINKVPLDGGRKHLYQVSVHPAEAAIVVEVITRLACGETATALAYELNARGVPTARGGKWWHKTLADMARDTYYRGSAGFGKREHIEPQRRRTDAPEPLRRPRTGMRERAREEWWSTAAVEPLIAAEVQDRAIAQLARNRIVCAAHPTRVYLLRGLLICQEARLDGVAGPCGCRLSGHAPASGRGARPSYQCNRHYMDAAPGQRHTCPGRAPAEELDSLVWERLTQALSSSADLRAALERLQESPAREREQWQSAIATLGAERERLQGDLRTQQRLLEQGVYKARDYQIAQADILPRLEECEDNLERARRALAAVRAPAPEWAHLERLVSQVRAKAATATPEQRAGVLGTLVQSIEVHRERLVIHGVLGELEAERAGKRAHQSDTERPSSIELVPFHLVVARRGHLKENGQGAGQAADALTLGQLAS